MPRRRAAFHGGLLVVGLLVEDPVADHVPQDRELQNGWINDAGYRTVHIIVD